jgi:hypothetical protein
MHWNQRNMNHLNESLKSFIKFLNSNLICIVTFQFEAKVTSKAQGEDMESIWEYMLKYIIWNVGNDD